MELNIRYFVKVNQSEAHFNALNFVRRKEIAVQNVHHAARPVIRRKRERQLNEIQPGKHLATKIPTQRLTMKPSEGTEKYQTLGSQPIVRPRRHKTILEIQINAFVRKGD